MLKVVVLHKCLELLTALAAKFSKSRSLWNKFKKTQMGILDREEERSNDEGEADFDGDEDLEVGGEGDMKSDMNIVEIGQFGGLHIYVSGIGHGFVH